jgi:FKBP-type peptidyl-prolyl cis-trans isomerase FkpA
MKFLRHPLFLLALPWVVGTGAEATEPPAAAPPTYPPMVYAALGSSFAQGNHLDELGWTDAQVAAFLDGMRAAFQGKALAFDAAARRASGEIAQRVQELEAHKLQQAAAALAQPGRLAQYMKEMRKRFGLQLSDSGLGYNIQSGGSGVRPRPGDTVVVSYVAYAADGTTRLPQLSSDHVRVKLAGLLPGFMEGLQMMTVESKAVLVMPPALSFGENEWPRGVDRGLPLIFYITLHEVGGDPH